MSNELVVSSNHLILCHTLLLLLSVFLNIRVFSNESVFHIRWLKYWSFSSASVLVMNIQGRFPLVLIVLISWLSKGLSSLLQYHSSKCQFFSTHLLYSVQLLSCFWLFVIPWTAAGQASLSIANSLSLLKLMSIESVMPSSHLVLCNVLLLPPSIFPSISVFSSESILHITWP